MRQRNRAVCCLLTITANIFAAYTALAQQTVDSSRLTKHFYYSSVTLLSGAAAQFFGKSSGLLSVNFPYNVTDSAGNPTNNVFSAQKNKIFNGSKSYFFPILVEIGRLHHFWEVGMYWSTVEGELTNAITLNAGYGFIWYVDPRHSTSANGHPQRFAIKAALCLSYNADGSSSSSETFGSIDNANKTIYLLGYVAGPTFTTEATRNSPAKTYAVNTLQISYSQKELSLLPRISIANNPYRNGARWEWMIGYNFPCYDRGGILLTQEASGQSHTLGGPVNLNNPAITSSYNGKQITKTPYRFGGLYTSLLLSVGKHKDKGTVSTISTTRKVASHSN
jgi:hypothetical protein